MGRSEAICLYRTEPILWNGLAFVKNTLDNCTVLTGGNVALGNKQGGLATYTEPVSVSVTSGGAGNITLTAPGTGISGVLMFCLLSARQAVIAAA